MAPAHIWRDSHDADDSLQAFGREPQDPRHGMTVGYKNRTVDAGGVQHGRQVSGDFGGCIRLLRLRAVRTTGASPVDDRNSETPGERWSDHLPRPSMRDGCCRGEQQRRLATVVHLEPDP